MSTSLPNALSYARQGIPVFPCDPNDKTPCCMRGFHAAITDENQIRTWWLQYYPNSMIGTPCGSPSGFWVLDVDIDASKGIDGEASLLKLTAEHGLLPETRISATPRGGEQYFFNWNKDFDIHNSASKISVGLDVRGAGGYVIMPPSVRADGVAYRWLNSLPPADAPQWLIDAATKARYLNQCGTPRATRQADRSLSELRGEPDPNGVTPRIRAWAMGALKIACNRIVAAPAGKRNDTLNAEAFSLFQLVGAGYLDEQIVRARVIEAACSSGIDSDYGPKAVDKTINSAAIAGLARPRYYTRR